MGYQRCLAQFKAIDLNEMRPSGFLAKVTQSCEEKDSKVDKKHGWKDVDNCPVCFATARRQEFFKFGTEVVCCKKCSLRYAAKIPVSTEDIYSDEGYLPTAIESYMKNVFYRKERFGKERVELISQQIGSPRGKRLLDIGCGTGWFLEVAKECEFDVYGQELGKGLANWTSERLGIRIFNKSISGLSTEIKFDVITMFDLLEHVSDPLQLILNCKNLLNKDGIIVVFTPNFDSLSIHIMREHSNIIAPAEHLTYFTKKSAEVLAQKTNLNLTYYRTCGIDLGDLKSYHEWLGNQQLAFACERLYNSLQPLIDDSDAGNHLRFVLKKE
ncbi:class I SAM-dependent methyltransferase [Candidatus Omnitrophota bacterium]